MHNNNSLYAEIKVQYRRENNNFIRLYNIYILLLSVRFRFYFVYGNEISGEKKNTQLQYKREYVESISIFFFFYSNYY